MKNFEDFLSYLENQSNEDPDNVPLMNNIYVLDHFTPENFASFMQQHTEDVLKAAGVMTVHYLRIYHEWLQSQN